MRIMLRELFVMLSVIISTQMKGQDMSALLSELSGEWYFIAANNGKEVAPGIYSAGTDSICFTATPSSDGISLQCHSDCLYRSATEEYPGDWRLLVETNSSGEYRLGFVLDTSQPVSEKEFLEPADSYLEGGFFYWGGTEGGHRYIYLLAENADASAIIGMTFWSGWSISGAKEYSLGNEEHQSHKIYAVVSEEIPYAGSVGWIEIWASPKLSRRSDTSGIIDVSSHRSEGAIYDLQGRRLHSRPARGLYIQDGVVRVTSDE